MKASVNGGPQFDVGPTLAITLQLDGDETLPLTTITVTGGVLTVPRSHVTVTPSSGVTIKMFGDEEDDPTIKDVVSKVIEIMTPMTDAGRKEKSAAIIRSLTRQ